MRDFTEYDHDLSGRITTTGSANAYEVRTARSLTGYYQGLNVVAKVHAANTGAATLNVNGLGAVQIRKDGGTANVAAGDLIAGGIYDFRHDGTHFQCMQLSAPVPPAAREFLNANRTYYVRTDGNDSNDGLSDSAGGAFLTVQRALNVCKTIDFGGYTVTIQVRPGTYTGAIEVPIMVGQGSASDLIILGDETTPGSVVFSVAGNDVLKVSNNALVSVRGVTLTVSSGSHVAMRAIGGTIQFQNVRFGAGGIVHILSESAGKIFATGNYTVAGGSGQHWVSRTNSYIETATRTLTLSGTPHFSTSFAAVYDGTIFCDDMTFSGSATGQRYICGLNGVIFTGVAGPNYLPGDTAGSAYSGGQYL